MKLKGRPVEQWVLIALLVGACAVALLGPEVSKSVRNVANMVLAPLGEGGMYLAAKLSTDKDNPGLRAISPTEARRLRKINEELLGELQARDAELARMINQQVAMRKLYGRIPYGQWELIPARIVGAGSLPYGQSRVVNAGDNRGAVPGVSVTTRRLQTDRSKTLPNSLATISATALVGELTSTGSHTAELRLITDSGFSIGGKILRKIDPNNPRKITVTGGDNPSEQVLTAGNTTPVDVWARGDGTGGIIVPEVNAFHNILPGDLLVTSGSDGMLPTRIRIGEVAEVTPDPKRRGLFVSLRVRPHADLAGLREVYIVLPIGALGDRTDQGGRR